MDRCTDLQNSLLNALLSSETDAIVACDREGIIRFWNPGARRIFGFADLEALGRSLDIIIPERLRARHWEGYRKMMSSGESRYGSGDVLAVPALHKNGTQLSVEFSLVTLRDAGGGICGLAALMRDVTRRFEEIRMLRRQLRS